MATKSKASAKQLTKPLTIEIHGETIDLVATIKQSPEFADGLHEGFSKIAELFTQLNGAQRRGRSVCTPSKVSDGSCSCSEESVEQLQYEHTYYLNMAEHIQCELEKRGVGFIDLERDFASTVRLLKHFGMDDEQTTAWLAEARKRIDLVNNATPSPGPSGG